MRPKRQGCVAALGVAAGLLLSHGRDAGASPSMIRLGYPTCAACHLSPQGRGLLTEYGRGIDEAESLRGGVYEPRTDQRRLLQDLRLLGQIEHGPPNGGTTADWLPLARLWYRNATFINSHHRVSAAVSVDAPERAQASSPIRPAADPPRVFVSRAMWEYRPRDGLEIAVGRDVLPSGVEIADQSTFMRVRNEQGFADVPTHAKLFWWNERFQVVPYGFGPSGLEPAGYRTSGGGLLAEVITAGQRLVVGLAARGSTNRTFDERLGGIYARTGFGRWALLSEWDVTRRRWRETQATTTEITGFGQVLFYPKRWLIASFAVERLHSDSPFRDRRVRLRPELSMRLNSHVTVAASVRDQWIAADRTSPAFVMQLFLKTVP